MIRLTKYILIFLSIVLFALMYKTYMEHDHSRYLPFEELVTLKK